MAKKKVKRRPKTSNELIRETIRKHGLTRQLAADLLGVSLFTIHNWLRPESNVSFRKAPPYAAELLALKARDV